MHKTDFGLIGLGVMGKSISLNVADNDFSISVYNRTEADEAHIVSEFIQQHSTYENLAGYTDITEFVRSIKRPRKILLMIKAGKAIDAVVAQLLPFLEDDDIIIDGGNSLYKDTIRRTESLASKNIHFVGCGISGGEEGARKGPSIMPGGSLEAYTHISPILEKIAAKDKNNKPCCVHVGTDGAGHFVKMVHNGIEYAEMQLLAEIYSILKKTHTNEEIASILSDWNTRSEASYLLEITIAILRKKEGHEYIIDRILDKALSKGTGSWSSKAALDIGMPSTMISSAVFARYVSAFKEQRVTLSKSFKKSNVSEGIEYSYLEKAYRFARIINHQQGFELIQEASKQYNWTLNLSEIARIWTNGCIIRSQFMDDSIEILQNHSNYFEDKKTFEALRNSEKYIVKVLQYRLNNRISLDTFSAAYNYWISMTTANSSANIIQAQRDYFGAHTYQRNDIDNSNFFHTNW
ncbi:NADP-dependent phosphogluconate dehydrogenase [uncultured Kordia sp.]|uniref:NADP-dependent phosphogluconate dehydrogenase n=1 Tax=uncultured Kordia sp. TaxID=507699 RepID=UPI00260662C3|nr:NADP-dependent phosphogluconate dehydrogenase [uncultured Kordia sp.]